MAQPSLEATQDVLRVSIHESDSSSHDSASLGTQPAQSLPGAVRALFIKHWLPISFAVSILAALLWPTPGAYLACIVESVMALVFFISRDEEVSPDRSGLTLDTQELRKAQAHVVGVLYGVFSILFLTPCWGFVIRAIPLEPNLLTIGLVIYCLVPTSLGTGVAVCHSCKGNDGDAKMLTILTNTLGVATMPLMLKFLFINFDLTGLSIKVKLLNLFAKLSITILAPSLTGKLLREVSPPLKALAVQHRQLLSITSTTAMAVVTWQVLSSARDRLFELPLASTFSMIAIAISIFVFYVCFNAAVILCGFRGMPLPEAVAIIAMASQKSAPVAVTLISYTTSNPLEQGLLSIPAIVGQLNQIMLGSALAPHVARRVDAWQASQDAAAADVQVDDKATEQQQCDDVATQTVEIYVRTASMETPC